MSEKRLTAEERAALDAEIISILDMLKPEYQTAAFLYAVILCADQDDTERDPRETDSRIIATARALQQRLEDEAADPATSAERRERAQTGSKICCILQSTLQKKAERGAAQ